MKKALLVLSAAAVVHASLANVQAGDREWAVAGKVLTGVVAASVLARAIEPAPVYHYSQPVVVQSAPVVYQPAPVYVPAPAPVVVQAPAPAPAPTIVYVQSAPVVYQPAPVYVAAPPTVVYSFHRPPPFYYRHHARFCW